MRILASSCASIRLCTCNARKRLTRFSRSLILGSFTKLGDTRQLCLTQSKNDMQAALYETHVSMDFRVCVGIPSQPRNNVGESFPMIT